MSDRAFRIYKIFAAVLCVCAFAVGGFLGWLSLRIERDPEERPLEPIVLPTQTTVPPTTAPTEPPMPENLSPEEQLYWEYFNALEYKDHKSYSLSDMDGNGVPEMLIWNDPNGLQEIVTIENGVPVSVIKGYDIFLCEGNILGKYGEGSGGSTVWYYKIDSTQVKPQVCLVWLFEKDQWHNSPDFTGDWATMTPITKERQREILSQYLPLNQDFPETGYLHFLYNDILNGPIGKCANE